MLRLAMVAAMSVCSTSAMGAYLFEIDTDGADNGVLVYNLAFSFGGDTTTASQSATCTAYGCNGADSIFGGNGTLAPDTYRYSYTPDATPDNLAIPAGTDLGEGNTATGATGGSAGTYRVYAAWPFTSNVSGGLTRYEVTTPGDSFTIDIDQNGGGAGRGNEWVLLGEIEYTSGEITVTQSVTGGNTFISMRAYGLLFEFVPPTDCPGDANGDGVVDFADLTLVLGNYGNSCN